MSAKAQDTSGAKKKKLPMPMIIGVIVLAVALFFGKGMLGANPDTKAKKSRKSKSSSKEDSKSKHDDDEDIEVGSSLALDEFLVNLTGNGDHYLRTTLALGLRKGLTEEKAKEHIPAVRDAILTVLSTKTLKELSHPKGRDELKSELVEKINETAEDEPICGKIYFTAFATQ